MLTVTRYSVMLPSWTLAWLETTSTPVIPRTLSAACATATRTASENDFSDEPTSWITFATDAMCCLPLIAFPGSIPLAAGEVERGRQQFVRANARGVVVGDRQHHQLFHAVAL